jgi:chromosome segregation ATPase
MIHPLSPYRYVPTTFGEDNGESSPLSSSQLHQKLDTLINAIDTLDHQQQESNARLMQMLEGTTSTHASVTTARDSIADAEVSLTSLRASVTSLRDSIADVRVAIADANDAFDRGIASTNRLTQKESCLGVICRAFSCILSPFIWLFLKIFG